MFTTAARPGRRARLLFAFLALCFALTGLTVVAGGKPASATDSCGAIQATVNGVDVKSNYTSQGTGSSCGGSTLNTATTPSGGTVTTGSKWQCVEFINRYYAQKGWISSEWYGNGNTLKNTGNLPSGLTFMADGSITSIVVGDAVTLDDGGYGHVGVVSAVNVNTITIANQNVAGAVFLTATYNPTTKTLSSELSGFTTQGIVHATNNPNTNESGYEAAFQAAGTGQLYLYGNAGIGGTSYTVASGTSPSIAHHGSGSYEVAFRNSSNGDLYVAGGADNGDTGLGIASGTSPSIAALSTGGYEIAFQAAGTGQLYLYGNADNGNTGLGIASGTSPSIE